ncbi:2Fe-2S iron-sulfur cluster binding domain-containing protein [bacterium]|nr:2Fe-2S iron-sulfur cluster binding domain-containing protein [bacterium]
MLQLILSLLALSGIGALLALLLEIADSYIANYGESHILINNEKDVVVEGGSPLLFSLMENEIFIPSACGGKGTCSMCKLRVLDGGGPVLPTETPYLNKDEMHNNVRLSCQVKVRNDLKIEIPEELFLVKEFLVRVGEIEDLTPSMKALHLKILTPEEGISFKAGQYIQLEVPKYELTRGPEYRAYSVASGAGEAHDLELVITKVPDGAVTTYVHDYLKINEELRINGPYGDFYLRDSDRDILFIATGSGLAPIKSMLHQIEKEEIKRKTTLFFGARTRKDLLYYEKLRDFEKHIPNFAFVPTLSRPTEEDQWDGEKGRVTDLIEKHIPENANIQVYICGAPTMVDSCEDILKKKGIPVEQIFYDKFE